MTSLTYTHKCPICTNKGKLPITPMLNSHDVTVLLDLVYRGVYDSHNLPGNFYIKTAKLLEDELNNGFGETTNPNQKQLYGKLRSNLYYFSAAKTYHVINFLLPEEKENRDKYEERATDILNLFIGDYFAVEKDTALQSSKTAKKWTKFEARKTTPYLEYVTKKDNRVRPTHAILDGIIREQTDSFWNTFAPPNGWLCRCVLKSTPKGEQTDLTDFDTEEALYNVPPTFRNNSGMSGRIFPHTHPYFKLQKGDKDFAKNNFDLPLPHNYK